MHGVSILVLWLSYAELFSRAASRRSVIAARRSVFAGRHRALGSTYPQRERVQAVFASLCEYTPSIWEFSDKALDWWWRLDVSINPSEVISTGPANVADRRSNRCKACETPKFSPDCGEMDRILAFCKNARASYREMHSGMLTALCVHSLPPGIPQPSWPREYLTLRAVCIHSPPSLAGTWKARPLLSPPMRSVFESRKASHSDASEDFHEPCSLAGGRG